MTKLISRLSLYAALAGLAYNVWSLRVTVRVQEELAVAQKTAPPVPVAKRKPAPAKIPSVPVPVFAGPAADVDRPLLLPDGTNITVKDMTPPSFTIHRPTGVGTLLANNGNEPEVITVEDIRNNPDFMAQMTKAAAMSASSEFNGFLMEAGFSPEQKTAFLDLIAQRNVQLWLQALQFTTNPDATAQDLADMDGQILRLNQAADARAADLLGNDTEYANYVAFRMGEPEREALRSLQGQGTFGGAHVTLPAAEADALMNILTEEAANAHLPSPLTLDLAQSRGASMDSVLAGVRQADERIYQRALAVLKPEDIEALTPDVSAMPGSMKVAFGPKLPHLLETGLQANARTAGLSTLATHLSTNTAKPEFIFIPAARSGYINDATLSTLATGADGTVKKAKGAIAIIVETR